MLWTIVGLYLIYKLLTWALPRALHVGDHANKHVLITGCDTGFGNLLAKRLDGEGFNVFAGCLTSAGAEKLQEACSSRVTTLLLDVTEDKSISAARQLVESKLPSGRGLWGIVNNAGIAGTPAPSEWLTKSEWDRCLAVNLHGVVQVTRTFLPLVREARGRVVNVASMMGRIAAAPAPYCVTKFGVEAFSDCLRREVYNQGIKVCILEPGYFKTDILNTTALANSFKTCYDATPSDIRRLYPRFSEENFTKLVQKVHQVADDLHQVVDAMILALTSRFPPTRQLVGMDCRLVFRLLWNLPTPISDWVLTTLLK